MKVLDFGLAKALDTTPAGDPSQSPTLTAAATQMGVIMGTAAYMSPEQARGKPVDKRADIWAFGAVLYEMLTGHRAFEGEDVSLTLARVLEKHPDWDAVPPSTPRLILQLLKRCLLKDPRRRLRDIGDAVYEFERQPEARPEYDTVSAGQTAVAVSRWRMVAFGAIAAAVVLAFLSFRPQATAPPTVAHLKLPVEGGLGIVGIRQGVAVAPSGEALAYADPSGRLYVTIAVRRRDDAGCSAGIDTVLLPRRRVGRLRQRPGGEQGFYPRGRRNRGGAAATRGLGSALEPLGRHLRRASG